MKTAGRRTPNRWATVPCTPSQWRGRSEPISLDHLGWEARKTPADGDVFFLDFPLYRTSQELAHFLSPTVRLGTNVRMSVLNWVYISVAAWPREPSAGGKFHATSVPRSCTCNRDCHAGVHR